MASGKSPEDFFLPKRAFTGGCHCGQIRYSLKLALPSEPIDPKNLPDALHPTKKPANLKAIRIYKCNCTICHKAGIFHVRPADPPADIIFLSPLNLDELGDYRCNQGKHHWYFCQKCGVRCITTSGPTGWEKAKIDIGGWKSDCVNKGEDEKKGEMVEVLRPCEGWVEGKPDYLSINAVTLDPGQEGLDLREWHEKGWVAYVNCLDDSGPKNGFEPFKGGLY